MKTNLILIMILLAVAFAGCSKKEKTEDVTEIEEKQETVIAKVGDRSISADDFKEYISSRPMRNSVAPKDVEKQLDEMVMTEILYQEALRLKMDQNFRARRSIMQMLNQMLLEEQVNRKVWGREIGDDELKEYYDQHHDEYNRPEQLRLADIFIAVPPDASEKQKTELMEKAKKSPG